MDEEHQSSSRQIVDEIVQTYLLGRYHAALHKIESALQQPNALTKEHRSLLLRAKRRLSKRLAQSGKDAVSKSLEAVDPIPADRQGDTKSGDREWENEIPFISIPLTSVEYEPVSTANCKILDTNIIIDGRIAEICRTGFLAGPLYVPGFVLEELLQIADSSDSLKRARGRRGLHILSSMQKELPLIVRSWDKALDKSAQNDEVDTRLVKLAKALDGVIVTNDFNLNKVAALQGVQVLNVNELANALKPVVLPGEVMTVGIVKEGKESNQGVAYLDDGTMIVVEDGRRYIGDTLGVIVTSVLQTVAGKMIFARVRTENEGFQG